MAEFEIKVYSLTIEEHPNADVLELARVGDYRSVVGKGQYKTGDLGVYLPEGAVLPEWMIKELGLEGRLAGKEKNRIKAVKLRGILSQGLIFPVEKDRYFGLTGTHCDAIDFPRDPAYNDGLGLLQGVVEGSDVTSSFEKYGVYKYEPPIPVCMNGVVEPKHGYTINYDIENIKKYPDVLVEGEEVVVTEKLHGTWCMFGYHPGIATYLVSSKGLSAQGLVFKTGDENKGNLYLRALEQSTENGRTVIERAVALFGLDCPIYILGEVYGKGVQDLHYGTTEPQFRVFDIYVGTPGHGRYLNWEEKKVSTEKIEAALVPVLYEGPFSHAKIQDLTDGTETVSGIGSNIREGVVITPILEREADELGRVILKSVSEGYILRKGGTELN